MEQQTRITIHNQIIVGEVFFLVYSMTSISITFFPSAVPYQICFHSVETLSRRTVSSRRSKNEKGTAAVVDLTKEDIAAFRNFHEQPKLPCVSGIPMELEAFT